MLLRELKQFNEAISLIHLTPVIKRTLYASVVSVLDELPNLRNNLIKFKDEVDIGYSTAAQTTMGEVLGRSLLVELMDSIHTAINDHVHDTLAAVTFKKLNNPGHAQGTVIVLNSTTIYDLGKRLTDQLFDISYNTSYDFFDAVFTTSIPKLKKQLYNDHVITKILTEIANTVVHELVHVVQHAKQKHRPTTEYRSYLSRNKNEFHSLSRSVQASKFDPSTRDYARWMHLYRASPQEITAFAHDIANRIISDNQLDSYDVQVGAITMSELTPQIVNAIKLYLHPNTRIEQKIFNRYVKLVYLELKNYIDQLIDQSNN